MICRDDILGMCGLEEAQIAALAEHEHIPEMAAAALGAWLLARPDGEDRIAEMICEDIQAAWAAGDERHARELFSALRHFCESHHLTEAEIPRGG